MYNNHVYQRGRVDFTPADDYPYPTGDPRSVPSARGPYRVPVHAGAAPRQPSIPEYRDQAPRPVYRHRPSPVDWPVARTQTHASARAPNPFASLPPAPLWSTPAVNYRPFHVHPSNVDPGRFEFSHDELGQLRSAGFRREDQRRLAAMPNEHFRFVMQYVAWLGSTGFSPAQIMDTARLAPNQRRFVASQCAMLIGTGLSPGHIIDLAQMAQGERRFVQDYSATLKAIGFTPMQILVLANCPDHERRYITDHGPNLHAQGYLPLQIRQQARDVSLRPASLQWTAYGSGAAAALPQPGAGYGGQHYPQQYDSRYYASQQPTNQQYPGQQYSGQQAQHQPYPNQPYPNQQYPNQPVHHPDYFGQQPYNGVHANQQHPSPRYYTEPAELAPVHAQPDPHARQHAALALRPPRRASTSEAPRRQAAAAAVEASPPAAHQHGRRDPAPRQATAPETPGLSYAERLAFDELDLPPGALDRLARGSDTFKTYVLAHGATLLASGMTFDEICAMASDSELPAGTHGAGQADAAPHVDYPRNNAPLTEDQRSTLTHAHLRWSRDRWTREVGEAFYRDTVPEALVRAVSAPQPDAHGADAGAALSDLHLLLAGVAYVADNRGADAPGHRARVTRLTAYLTAKNDPELLRECDAAAAEGVTRCVDRIAFGLTRVEQVVMRRKVDDGEMAPREMLDSIEKVFVQHLVHDLGTHLANARKVRNSRPATDANYTRESFAAHVEQAQQQSYQVNPATGAADSAAGESLEMYAALAPVLAARGVNMVESARTSTYGGMYQIEPLELDYALGIIDGHVRDRSDKFLDDFKGNPAVEKVLRQCFPQEYDAMREQREELQDEADDALFDANATTETQEAVRDVMTALANMDQDWFREKLLVVLAQPHRLDSLLAHDQAQSAS